MPNNTALGAGAGILQGFNSVILPYLERQGEVMQANAINETKALRAETRELIEQKQHLELFKSDDPGDAEANQWLYTGWNTPPPKNLVYWLAKSKQQLRDSSNLVGREDAAPSVGPRPPVQAGASPAPQQPAPVNGDPAQNVYGNPQVPGMPPIAGAPAAAPPDPYTTQLSPEEQPAFAAWKAKYAPNDSGVDYDLQGAFKAGVKPDAQSGHFPDTFKKPNHPTFSNESQYAQMAPEKAGHWVGEQFIPPDGRGGTITTNDEERQLSPEQRAAHKIEEDQRRGLDTVIKINGLKQTFHGLTYNERDKARYRTAARKLMQGGSLEDALASVDDPKQKEGLAHIYASDGIKTLLANGWPVNQAVEAIASQTGRDFIPKIYADQVYGPQTAAAKAQAVAPIQVDTASRKARNAAEIKGQYDHSADAMLMRELGMDPSQPMDPNSPDAIRFNAVKEDRAKRLVGSKEEAKIDARITKQPQLPVKRSELQKEFDPESGEPIAKVLKDQGRTITYGDLTNAGSIPLDESGISILRSAPQANKVLSQYLSAALDVFKSEDPNKNLADYYTSWVEGKPEYQRLVAQNGKLSQIIRLMGERGALAEGDVTRGQDSLLQMRGRVSKSELINAVREVNDVMQTGLRQMGFTAENILPTPQEAAPKRISID